MIFAILLSRWLDFLRVLCAFAVFLPSSLPAGEFNEVLFIGDKAPEWKDLPGTDGKPHSLADLKDKDVVVLVFTCVSCPTAVDYEGRINDLAKKHAGGKVAVVPVSVNRIDADKLPALTKRVQEQGFAFHYLYDESQKIAKDHGAIFTPEFFVFGKDRKLVYMGAMDDSTDPEGVKAKHVEDAIAAAIKGEKPAVTETIARGCRVRYARERRE
ncbi:MAG: thioredoxin family protein [Planctomycetaceae bacterium]|nr:thioredoxin family protein [Planctomycetaceae bacterium]